MKTVLVVDDDPDTADLYSIVLMGKGLNVLTANSIPEALEKVYENKVDLLLTDLYLKDGLGSELPGLMRNRAPQSFILMTGRELNPWVRYPDFQDYLLKPINLDTMYKTVMSCLNLEEQAS